MSPVGQGQVKCRNLPQSCYHVWGPGNAVFSLGIRYSPDSDELPTYLPTPKGMKVTHHGRRKRGDGGGRVPRSRKISGGRPQEMMILQQ